MSIQQPRRRARVRRRTAALGVAFAASVAMGGAAADPARAADGPWDRLLETMNVKAAPAAPGPDFVERTRPDPADLGYLPTATPHKVSPLAVKTPAQIQAEKDALDLARARQLAPASGKPVAILKAASPPAAPPAMAGKARPAPKPAAVAD